MLIFFNGQMKIGRGEYGPACVPGTAAGSYETCSTGGSPKSGTDCASGAVATSLGDCISGTSVTYTCETGPSGWDDPFGCRVGPAYVSGCTAGGGFV